MIDLDIASLRAAYETHVLTPEVMIDQLYDELEQHPLHPVWIHRLSREEARQRAADLGAIEGRRHLSLYGIPFAVKDNIDVAGMPTTAGCPDFAYMPTRSAAVVRSLQQAGAICIGKANLDQFATGLVGTRSPFGKCRNVFDERYLSGGSSSGSAVAVAKRQVTFALGTDTAGSGRIPAALNNVVGVKPSRGLFSNEGVVPACTSLDCVSVLATSVHDGARVRDVITGQRTPPSTLPRGFRFAVPSKLEFCGDTESERLFESAVRQLQHLGGIRVPVEWGPFAALGDMLYGPWVVERYLSVGEFLESTPAAGLPVTRKIILGARRYTATDAFRAFKQTQDLVAICTEVLRGVHLMVTPTVPTHFRVEDDQRDPVSVNDKLGIYSRFVNFLGSPVLAVPAGFRRDGLPFGVSLVGLPGADGQLDPYGKAIHEMCGGGPGGKLEIPPLNQGPRRPTSVPPRMLADEARI
ncbi:MAG: allophanate hydrolase [Myxococcales bacterium]